MIVTEAEAATKWCPQAVARNEHPITSGNRWYSGEKETHEPVATCLGSRCMFWRWHLHPNSVQRRYLPAWDPKATTPDARPASIPRTWGFVPYSPEDEQFAASWIEPDAEAAARATGYCGLAYVGRAP